MTCPISSLYTQHIISYIFYMEGEKSKKVANKETTADILQRIDRMEDNIGKKVDAIDDRLQTVERKVTNLGHDMKEVKHRLTNIERNTDDILGIVSFTHENAVTHDEVKSRYSTQ